MTEKQIRILRSAAYVCGALILSHNVFAQIPGFEKTEWQEQKIAPGLVWKHAHISSLFGAPQNINILMIDTKKRPVTLVYSKDRNRLTSDMAAEANAEAAVNAGFFDMKNGGSVTYLKTDGTVPDTDTLKWKRIETLNGALIIRTDGSFAVEPAGKYADFTANEAYDDVLFTGSLLMDEGKTADMPDVSFVTRRHPRTCLGLINKNKILLLTVDGRSDQSAGMTLPELTELMQALKCHEAINLDGGGSTTMWIKDKTETGVVNMPSDNKQFDHGGERVVSNILVVQ